MAETSKEKFMRLGTARTVKALHAIRLLENLGNYDHDHTQTEKIVTALRNAIDTVEHRLGGAKSEKAASFNLGDDE